MQLIINNLTAAELGPIVGLPDGGKIPASGSKTFDLQSGAQWDAVRDAVEALRDAADLSYSIRPDATDSDAGERIYLETLRVQAADLTAAAVSETIEDDFNFPVGARLLGYFFQLDAEAAGGGATSCVVDAGFGAGAEADLLDDGKDIFAGGVGVGESFGAGGNATPNNPHPIGGKALRALVTSDVNVADLTACDFTLSVLYSVH